jgi:hypothetical protein
LLGSVAHVRSFMSDARILVAIWSWISGLAQTVRSPRLKKCLPFPFHQQWRRLDG